MLNMIETNLSTTQKIILISFSLLSSVMLGISKTARLRKSEFFEQDLSLSYSFDDDQISTSMLWTINFLIMFFVFVVSSIKKKNDTILFAFFLFNNVVIVSAITEYLKKAVGEPRPSAFYLCNYAGYKNAVESGNYTDYYESTKFGKIGDIVKCKNYSDDAFMSWPSGHSSTAFASMFSSAILLHYAIEFKELFLNLIYYLLLIIATFISVTRVEDNKHHTYDIECGAIVGLSVTGTMWYFVKFLIENNKKLQNNETVTNNNYYFEY